MAKQPENASELIFYQTEDGRTRLEVRLENETVWLTQNQMSALFQTTKQNISQHIKNVFSEKELREISVVKDFFTTAADKKLYQIKYYNLDVIISVGYRVKSLARPARTMTSRRRSRRIFSRRRRTNCIGQYMAARRPS